MTSLITRPTTSPARSPLTGSPLRWARDFALVGGGQLSLIAMLDTIQWEEASILVGVGVVFAAILGGVMAPALERSRRLVPFRWLWLPALLASAGWGVATVTTFLTLNEGLPLGDLPRLVAVGSSIGVAVFGVFWLVYTVAAVMKWRRWPLVLGTVPLSLLTGAALVAFWS